MAKSQLHWKPAFTLTRKPTKKSIARRSKAKGSPKAGNTPHQYEFVCEYPTASDPICHGVSTPSQQQLTDQAVHSEEHDGCDDEVETVVDEASLPASRITSPNGESVSIDDVNDDTAICHQNTGTPGCDLPSEPWPPSGQTSGGRYGLDATHRDSDTFGPEEPNSDAVQPAVTHAQDTTVEDSNTPGRQTDAVMKPFSVMYNSVWHRFGPVLDRYNKEFCKIPLTTDLEVNPFQYHAVAEDAEPMFLLHAVMALAGHHTESPTTEHHRRDALQLLRAGISKSSGSGSVYHFLDTIIILFSLDETQSTLGNWNTHLTGAFALLEAIGGINRWTRSPRAVVQVALLTWWDAIISLVSREDCVFPLSYFEAAVESSSSNNKAEWDYFGLCGCPLSLVRIVMRLARLSAEKSKSESMQYVKLDDSITREIQESLETWQHVSPPQADEDETSMHQDLDCMHCSEAWKHGLLIYLYRVFEWKPGVVPPIKIARRARLVADHVFACRTNTPVGKQALLPLFFAGCELRDESTRHQILEHCTLWNEMTRYNMFNSAKPLLEEVWAEQDRRGFENVWWGQLVDRKHQERSTYPLRMRICFG